MPSCLTPHSRDMKHDTALPIGHKSYIYQTNIQECIITREEQVFSLILCLDQCDLSYQTLASSLAYRHVRPKSLGRLRCSTEQGRGFWGAAILKVENLCLSLVSHCVFLKYHKVERQGICATKFHYCSWQINRKWLMRKLLCKKFAVWCWTISVLIK